MEVVECSAHGLDRDWFCSKSDEYKLTTAALVPLILDGPRIRLFKHGPTLLPVSYTHLTLPTILRV